MFEDDKEPEVKENRKNSTKRKLSSDESVAGSENEQIDKKKKLSLESEEVAKNKEKSLPDQAVSNDLSEDNYKINTSSDVSSRPVKSFEPECKLCHKRFYSSKTYYEHIESVGHKKKENPAEKVECEICERTFVGRQTYEAHLSGKHHKKKLIAYELGEKFKGESSALPSIEEAKAQKSSIFNLRCQVCNKRFSGLIPYDLHMSSPSHCKMVEKATLEKIASCAICNMTFSGLTTYEMHMSSPLHMRNVQRARTASYGNHSFNNNFNMQNNWR